MTTLIPPTSEAMGRSNFSQREVSKVAVDSNEGQERKANSLVVTQQLGLIEAVVRASLDALGFADIINQIGGITHFEYEEMVSALTVQVSQDQDIIRILKVPIDQEALNETASYIVSRKAEGLLGHEAA